MKKLLAFILNSMVVVAILKIAKKITLPGFQRLSIFEVSSFFIKGINEGALPMRASAVSFSFFLAMFPTIIFVFTLIPYIPIPNFQDQLLGLLKGFMPGNAYEAMQETIEDIVKNQRGGLLSIGFISAMYFSTNGFNALITAFNNTFHGIEVRKPFHQRLISILLVIISTTLILGAISLLIISEYALQKIFTHGEFVYYIIQFGRWITVFGLFFCLISFAYYLGPSQKARWKFVSAGSTLATLLMVITSVGFAFYVDHFGNYNKLYGSIGTLIVVLLWLYFNSLVLLLGFDLNASIYQAKKRKADPFTITPIE